jgi:hypothetical protein
VAHPLLDRVPDLVLDQVPGWFQSQRCPVLLSSAPQFCSSAGPSGALVPDLALALVQLLVPGRVGSSSALALDRGVLVLEAEALLPVLDLVRTWCCSSAGPSAGPVCFPSADPECGQ